MMVRPELLRSAQADHLLTAYCTDVYGSGTNGGMHGVRLCS